MPPSWSLPILSSSFPKYRFFLAFHLFVWCCSVRLLFIPKEMSLRMKCKRERGKRETSRSMCWFAVEAFCLSCFFVRLVSFISPLPMKRHEKAWKNLSPLFSLSLPPFPSVHAVLWKQLSFCLFIHSCWFSREKPAKTFPETVVSSLSFLSKCSYPFSLFFL